MRLRLATRASRLALWQAEAARDALAAAWSDLELELVTVQSSGEVHPERDLARFGQIGIFTVEVDRAVLDGRAEAAVHSLKDLTTVLEDGMELAAVLGRGPAEDALVARAGHTLAALPAGARLATGSLRRAALVRAERPELEIVGLRGNVETRLAKLAAGEADALVLALAGLERLGLAAHVTEVLGRERFVPAVGQGLVGITCRAGDAETLRRLAAVRDLEGWDEARAERACLRELRGGCNVPLGAHARAAEGALALHARVLSLDGAESVEGRVLGLREEAEELGARLARELLARGAARLVAAARS